MKVESDPGRPSAWSGLVLSLFWTNRAFRSLSLMLALLSCAVPTFGKQFGESLAMGRWDDAIVTGALIVIGIAGLALNIWMFRAKEWASKSVNIVLLRPFEPSAAVVLKRHMVPTLSAYGSLRFAGDAGYEAAERLFGQDADETATVTYTNDSTWKDVVQHMIDGADIVVVDVSRMSEALWWEVEQAVAVVPFYRIMTIAYHTASPVDSGFIDRWHALTGEAPSAPIRYGGWLRTFHAKLAVHRWMRALSGAVHARDSTASSPAG